MSPLYLFAIIAAVCPVFAAPAIDFTVPEPEKPAHVMRVMPQTADSRPLSPETEQQLHHGLLERCRLMLPPQRVQPRLVRRGNEVHLHLYTPLKTPPGVSSEHLLQLYLNRVPNTCFLGIHPQTETLLRRPDIRDIIARYEQAVTTWMEGPRCTPPPRPAELPPADDTAGYMLAEYPGRDRSGQYGYDYLIIRQPEVARAEALLVTNRDVVSCTISSDDPRFLDVRLSPEASERFRALTRSLAAAGGSLALVSDGSVLCHLRMNEELSGSFKLKHTELQNLRAALLPPMPCKVKMESVLTKEGKTPY